MYTVYYMQLARLLGHLQPLPSPAAGAPSMPYAQLKGTLDLSLYAWQPALWAYPMTNIEHADKAKRSNASLAGG
jgi:hypothetical protein